MKAQKARPGTYVRTPAMRKAARKRSLKLWKDPKYRFNQKWGRVRRKDYLRRLNMGEVAGSRREGIVRAMKWEDE